MRMTGIPSEAEWSLGAWKKNCKFWKSEEELKPLRPKHEDLLRYLEESSTLEETGVSGILK